MKKIKISIQDENTLILFEDAQKGDLIDLKSIHEADIDKTSTDSLIKSIKTNKSNTQLETAIYRCSRTKNETLKKVALDALLEEANEDKEYSLFVKILFKLHSLWFTTLPGAVFTLDYLKTIRAIPGWITKKAMKYEKQF